MTVPETPGPLDHCRLECTTNALAMKVFCHIDRCLTGQGIAGAIAILFHNAPTGDMTSMLSNQKAFARGKPVCQFSEITRVDGFTPRIVREG